MEPVCMDIDSTQQLDSDPLPFARSYQLEALEKAIQQNTIVFLETGSGKTLIAIMLLRSYAHFLRKPSPFIAVFLVPQVVLVKQQAEALQTHTDLNVGMYWGEMGIDFWGAETWNQQIEQHEVFVMTPQILLDGLRHSFFKLELIKVLIFDECHHARGKHPYACILTEFYHRQLSNGNSALPKIFGMTASPIKTKGAKLELACWKDVRELENMMYSKVYTCASESVLAEFIPFSNVKFRFYKHMDIPYAIYATLAENLKMLKSKYETHLKQLDLTDSVMDSTSKRILKMHSNFMYCLDELGVWLAHKAAQVLSCHESNFFSWNKLDISGETIVKDFSLEASRAFDNCIRSGPNWFIGDNAKAAIDAGLLTTKTFCLIESLLEYRDLMDIRCIIFVDRVIAAVVLQSLLCELLPRYNNSWKTKYIAGNNSGLQCQSRKIQNEIVNEFREGKVNIIVATSILEEGLDVQSCNLVVRFDPSTTVSSFIQSRGRARMKNSDYLLMVKSGDVSTCSRLENYLASGELMRKESIRHGSVPCSPIETELQEDEFYCVESTNALATLSSSISLIHFYCSRLPSDGYFKPAPRCLVDKELEKCTLLLPKSCPIQTICVEGNVKTIKQKACLEACKQLHNIGALTDNLVPDIVEETIAQESGAGHTPYCDEQPIYFPPELVGQALEKSEAKYYCYLIELNQNFVYEVRVHNIVLVLRNELESDILSMDIDLEVDRGSLAAKMKYIGQICLPPDAVVICRKFFIALLKVLMGQNIDKLEEILRGLKLGNNPEIDYFLLPLVGSCQRPSIDWESIMSVLFSYENSREDHKSCPLKENARVIQTKNGVVCTCMIQNSLVYTPHNGKVYCINGTLDHLNGHSLLELRNGERKTYVEYYKTQYGIKLHFDQEILLRGRHIFPLQNYQQRFRHKNAKVSQNAYVQLPPELCHIFMSPISMSTLYSFTFVPSIMHQLESFLIAINLKKMHLDHSVQNVVIPTSKVLEAITTKKCQEKFHLESLETLGDSFLKYAVGQQLFKTHQSNHEGLLSLKKDKLISNATLCRLGCDSKIPGFIRNESFDPKNWPIPGENSGSYSLNEEFLSNTQKIYTTGLRKLKLKLVADVVEALIGAFLSTGGEIAALFFLDWIGIKACFTLIPYERGFEMKPDKYVNIGHLESLLKYSFKDPCLLVEALTHGSYMLPEIPRCYQRLEFLGDAVLDYLITVHLYEKYPGMSPGLLTDMRSASVNNDCYGSSAVREGLYKYILHASQKLHKDIVSTVTNYTKCSSESTFGWESEISFPKVLGDVIESLAGAIFVDSGYNKEAVFNSIRPLLEPLITPETIKLHPVRELTELCQKEHFDKKKSVASRCNGVSSVTVEVEANGIVYAHTCTSADKKVAKRLACKEVLRVLKDNILKK
ncbi:endoribonuclease Dicer homolog 2 isoform X2 [Mercurialis annua]|uniref:endoribonuclease Dicer homolog 2 isoform X2 n=1 Tax=Mercurialis annua TaxID=3986 RepID=UPI00215F4C1B|nr:endoribonuclease Dicer homolog 2 isoform X2 [Mercurialis annua]